MSVCNAQPSPQRYQYIFQQCKQFTFVPKFKNSLSQNQDEVILNSITPADCRLVTLVDAKTGRVGMESGEEGVLVYKEAPKSETSPFSLEIVLDNPSKTILQPDLVAHKGDVIVIERTYVYTGDSSYPGWFKRFEEMFANTYYPGLDVILKSETRDCDKDEDEDDEDENEKKRKAYPVIGFLIKARVRDEAQYEELSTMEFDGCMDYLPDLCDFDKDVEEDDAIVCEDCVDYKESMSTALDLRLFM